MTETCHGKDFNHLIWDYQVVSNNWNKDQKQFVLTDGIIFEIFLKEKIMLIFFSNLKFEFFFRRFDHDCPRRKP